MQICVLHRLQRLSHLMIRLHAFKIMQKLNLARLANFDVDSRESNTEIIEREVSFRIFQWLSRDAEWLPSALYLFKLTSAFPQLHVTGKKRCVNHEIIPLNNHFCCFFQRRSNSGAQPLNIIFLECKLQWLPLLLLEGTLHFPPQHSISWRDDKTLPFHATYRDLTTLQYAHFAAASPLSPLSPPCLPLAYLINSVLAWLTVGFHLALLGVTSSWTVSQLTGAARLLCCDNIRLM